jgi:hypothetical protein
MRFFPHTRLRYTSPLSLPDIMRRVQANTAARPTGWRGWLAARPTQPYLGHVREAMGSFEVQRNISYRNSFLPLISGTVEVPGGVAALGQPSMGSLVQLTMRIHLLVGLFMLVWLSGVGLGCLVILVSWPGPIGLVPFGMLGFGVLMVSLGFWTEANKAEAFFKDLLLLTPTAT